MTPLQQEVYDTHSWKRNGQVEKICMKCGYVIPHPLEGAYWPDQLRRWGKCSGKWLTPRAKEVDPS